MSKDFLGIFLAFTLVGSVVGRSSRFDDLFQPSWALDHFSYEGELLKMKLDNHSGAGFSSKSKYLYGKVAVQIKLVEGDSAGTVTAFYVCFMAFLLSFLVLPTQFIC